MKKYHATSKTRISLPVSVLMPVHNEADIIEDVVEEWVRDVFQYLPKGSEFVFDEALSTDGTREILARLCKKYPFIRVNYHDTKDGFGPSARRLYSEARCPLVFFTDSDGQYVAADFWKLAKYIPAYDVVHGAKFGRKDSFFRRFFSGLFNQITCMIAHVNYFDINSAFRLIKAEVIKEILPQVNCMPTLLNTELFLRCQFENYSIKQIYITHRERKYGKSRGLPPVRYFFEGFRACLGVFKVLESYRK